MSRYSFQDSSSSPYSTLSTASTVKLRKTTPSTASSAAVAAAAATGSNGSGTAPGAGASAASVALAAAVAAASAAAAASSASLPAVATNALHANTTSSVSVNNLLNGLAGSATTSSSSLALSGASSLTSAALKMMVSNLQDSGLSMSSMLLPSSTTSLHASLPPLNYASSSSSITGTGGDSSVAPWNKNIASYGSAFLPPILPGVPTDYEDYMRSESIYGMPSLLRSSSSSAAQLASSSLYQASSKYGAPRNEYESLIKRYAELDSFHVEVVHKLSMTQAENQQHRKRNDEMLVQLSQALREKDMVQGEYDRVLQHLDKACRTVEDLKQELDRAKTQRDEANKQCKDAMDGRNKAFREKQKMYEERNAAVREWNQIMSERDNVHKEMERLHEEVHELQKKHLELTEKHRHSQEELEGLRRELASALLDRDQALKTCSDLRERLGDAGLLKGHSISQQSLDPVTGPTLEPALSSSSNSSLVGHHHHHLHQSPSSAMVNVATSSFGVAWGHTKNILSKSMNPVAALTTSSSTSSVSTFGATGKLEPVSVDLANPSTGDQSMEQLRRHIERLQLDLFEANKEMEVYKKRRDWAFTERDKIVLERESVRALCNRLRRERDRSVSDYADANIQINELRQQKEEFDLQLKLVQDENKNLKLLLAAAAKANAEAATSSESGPGTCTSQDSALDVDDCWCYQEGGGTSPAVFELEMRREHLDQAWPFSVAKEDTRLVVTSLTPPCPLKLHDHLIQIDDLPTTTTDLSTIDAHLKQCCKMTVKVRRAQKPPRTLATPRHRANILSLPVLSPFVSDFDNSVPRLFGFQPDLQVLVSAVTSELCPLTPGDRILSVGGQSVSELLRPQLLQALLRAADTNAVSVKVLKAITCAHQWQDLLGQQQQQQQQHKIKPETTIASAEEDEDEAKSCGGDTIHNRTHSSSSTLIEQKSRRNTTSSRAVADSIESELDDDESRDVVDEDNDADEDETEEEREAEVKTLAKLDSVLEKYQLEEQSGIYGSSSSSGAEGTVSTLKARCKGVIAAIDKKAPIATVEELGATSAELSTATSSTSESQAPMHQPVVMRRSLRSKKNRDRRTLAASQLNEAAHELALASQPSPLKPMHSSKSSKASSSQSTGDTWPRYKPHQLLSSVLPSFYKHHAYELNKNYAKSKKNETTTPVTAASTLGRPTVKKQRKSLGIFFDLFPTSSSSAKTHKIEQPKLAKAKETMPEQLVSTTASKDSGNIFDVLTRQRPSPSPNATTGKHYQTVLANQNRYSFHSGANTSNYQHQVMSGVSSTGGASNDRRPISSYLPLAQYHRQLTTPHQLDADQIKSLVRQSHYSSIKNSFYTGPNQSQQPLAPPQQSSSQAQAPKYYSSVSMQSPSECSASNSTSATGIKSYSPIYATYSYRNPKPEAAKVVEVPTAEQIAAMAGVVIETPGESIQTMPSQASTQSVVTISAQAQPSAQNDMWHHPALVDYSVVSAQIQDKNVLNYYKTRHVIGGPSSPPPNVPDPTSNTNASMSNTSQPVSQNGMTAASTGPVVKANLRSHSISAPPAYVEPDPKSDLYAELYAQRRAKLTELYGPVPVRSSMPPGGSTSNYYSMQHHQQQQQQQQPIYGTIGHSGATTTVVPQNRHSVNVASSLTASATRDAMLLSNLAQSSGSFKDGLMYSFDPSQLSSSVVSNVSNQSMPYEHIYQVSKRASAATSVPSAPAPGPAAPNSEPPPPPPFYTGPVGSSSGTDEFDDQYLHLAHRSNRFRMPSNSSTNSGPASVRVSRVLPMSDKTSLLVVPNLGFIGDRNSYGGSSTSPILEVKWLKCEADGSPGSPIADCRLAKPDDYRHVRIEKSAATQLGIRILRCYNSLGVFVETVLDNSIAAQAGIRVGDQIIEICGINMRKADFDNAANILNQAVSSISMLIQHNFDKFKELQLLTNGGVVVVEENEAFKSVASSKMIEVDELHSTPVSSIQVMPVPPMSSSATTRVLSSQPPSNTNSSTVAATPTTTAMSTSTTSNNTTTSNSSTATATTMTNTPSASKSTQVAVVSSTESPPSPPCSKQSQSLAEQHVEQWT